MNLINDFENNMVSFERCYFYTKLETEPGIKSIEYEENQFNKNECIIEEKEDELLERLDFK